MAGKAYPHEVRVPRTLIDAGGVRSTAPTGLVPVPPANKAVGLGRFVAADPSAPNPIHNPEIGSNLIFSVGGPIRSKSGDEGEA